MSATRPDSRWRDLLQRRLEQVESRLQAACQRAGRVRNKVTLLAVTKTVSAEIAALLPELGVFDLGESRPQELWHKAALLPGSVRWHQIGHLQRNKVERTLPLATLIHSVDSERLLTALEEEAAKQQRTIEVLLEVNASHEASKHGFAASDLTAPGFNNRRPEARSRGRPDDDGGIFRRSRTGPADVRRAAPAARAAAERNQAAPRAASSIDGHDERL